jgi:hypothetical protein
VTSFDDDDGHRPDLHAIQAAWNGDLAEQPPDDPGPDAEAFTMLLAEADAITAGIPTRGPWEPVDLARVKDLPRPRPTIGRPEAARRGLLYPGKKHWIFGHTGCGKTWVALKCAEDTAAQRRRVLWIDMEDVAQAFADRCRTITDQGGYDLDKFLGWFDFIERPDEPATPAGLRALVEPSRRVGLVVLDGVSDYARLHRLDIDDNTEMGLLHAHLDVLASTGAAVVALDAAPKNRDDLLYPIGAQHKLAKVDGSAYRVEAVDPFSRTVAGSSALLSAKDRPGGVPGARGQKVAELFHDTRSGFRLKGSVAGWTS